jgi:hypothetical protein
MYIAHAYYEYLGLAIASLLEVLEMLCLFAYVAVHRVMNGSERPVCY